MEKVIDARERFLNGEIEYRVSIDVDCNLGFLLCVLKAMFLRKGIRINHTFDNDPFLNNQA